MGTRRVVFLHTLIEIVLKLGHTWIERSSEHGLVKLVKHRLLEALADAVGLRPLNPRARVLDVVDRQGELIRRAVVRAAVLGATVGQNPGQRDIVLLKRAAAPDR